MTRIFQDDWKNQWENEKVVFVQSPMPLEAKAYIDTLGLYAIEDTQVIDFTDLKLNQKFKQLGSEALIWFMNQSQVTLFLSCEFFDEFSIVLQSFEATEFKGRALCFYTPGNVSFDQLLETHSFVTLSPSYFPPTLIESIQKNGLDFESKNIENRLVYGAFHQPEIGLEETKKELMERVQRAILPVNTKTNRLNKPETLARILVYLSNHANETLSFLSIANWAGVDNETVQRYVNWMANTGWVYALRSYNQNHKYEYLKGNRFVFVDNGILNAFQNNFNASQYRTDVEKLWKNLLISERIKSNILQKKKAHYYFWQSHTHQNIDLIEVSDQGVFAFNFSFYPNKKADLPPLFSKYYPEISFVKITPTNYLNFLVK